MILADPDFAFIAGLGLLLILSVIIGMVFGAITASAGRLRIWSFRKGVTEGIIAGMIAFAVIFVPLAVVAIPATVSATVEDMGLGLTPQQVIATLSQSLPIILGMGFVGWVIFGCTLIFIISLTMVFNNLIDRWRGDDVGGV